MIQIRKYLASNRIGTFMQDNIYFNGKESENKVPSKVQKAKFNKVAEAAAEKNQKESWLHCGLTPSAYAMLITYGISDQKAWLSDAAIMKAESDTAFAKDAKEFSKAFANMRHWLMSNPVGRAGGNKKNLALLIEDEKSFAETYFGKKTAKTPVKALSKKQQEEATRVEIMRNSIKETENKV